MRHRLYLLLTALLVPTGTTLGAGPQVEIRANEVWVIKEGQARQLTNDGKSKLQAVFSPSGDRIAYYEQCPQSENCVPSIVVLDHEGKRLMAFHAISTAFEPAQPCASIVRISWLGDTSIASECHLNPSLSEYLETDLGTGKTVRDLFGYGFTPSPDRNYIAHVPAFPHFAPPFAQSNYLQIDATTVYPLPKGARPMRVGPTDTQPEVVRRRGLRWSGIHEFMGEFFWSPDSRRVAFVDCLYDWIQKAPDETVGDTAMRRCQVAVVSRTGKSSVFPIGTPTGDAHAVGISWDGPNQVSAQVDGTSQRFSVPKN